MQKNQELSEVLEEEFNQPKLAETESRWTKDGHLDIREEVKPTDIKSKSEEKKEDSSDESDDDDLATKLLKNKQRMALRQSTEEDKQREQLIQKLK